MSIFPTPARVLGLAPRRATSVSTAMALTILAGSAQALTIHTTFDSSITSRSNAGQIEYAFNKIANVYDANFSSPVTVNVDVSWGKVDGYSMSSGNLGESIDNLYGYYSYSGVKSRLQTFSSANPGDTPLKTALAAMSSSTPAGVSNYVVPSAEAKALGIISATQSGYDGYIGFGSGVAFDFSPSDGVSSGQYDFETVAAHELDEVLGRISGLSSTSPTMRTVFDLFRYGAPGSLSFAYNSAAYFSVDGGKTNLGEFNISSNGGDRGDWANAGATTSDIQDAFLVSGKGLNLTAADLAALDALGYAGTNLGTTDTAYPTMIAAALATPAPEPATWSMISLGLAFVGGLARTRRRAMPVFV